MEDLSLPVPDFQLINQHIQEQLSETDENTRQEKRLMGEMMAAQFNEGQRSVFDQVMASTNDVNNILPRLYFLDGPGGTGKSFLNNSIITVLQGQRKNVIAVASTRIASTLLIGSATYHSAFKLYPPITETTRSRIEAGSYAAELIRRADIIISDEATMKLNLALDAINELLQTTMKKGGKVLLLGGNFRQCLPVVKNGNRVFVTEASIIYNRTWPLAKDRHFTSLLLYFGSYRSKQVF
jgi:ATP-dependent DNA helicase PIF1